MAIWTTSDTLQDAINDWAGRGLIDPATASALSADIASQRRSFGFASILVLLAVICIGFGAITFVAANWEGMSRLARLGLLIGGIWGFWAAAIALRLRDQPWFAEVCVLGACSLFGASIMLLSQMYHIQGEPAGAVWLWAVGTLVAAALARSVPALCLAVMLWSLWPWLGGMSTRDGDPHLMFLVWIGICTLLALWMRSRVAAHLIALSLCAWVLGNAFQMLAEERLGGFLLVLMAIFVLLSAVLWSDGAGRFLRGFEKPGLFYVLAGIGGLIFALHLFLRYEFREVFVSSGWPLWLSLLAPVASAALAARVWPSRHPNRYDLTVTAVVALVVWALSSFLGGALIVSEAVMLILSIWVIRMGWRLAYRPLTVLGFLGFGGVLLLIYFETIGTLLGTSVFYLVAGGTLLACVVAGPRLMRRFQP